MTFVGKFKQITNSFKILFLLLMLCSFSVNTYKLQVMLYCDRTVNETILMHRYLAILTKFDQSFSHFVI